MSEGCLVSFLEVAESLILVSEERCPNSSLSQICTRHIGFVTKFLTVFCREVMDWIRMDSEPPASFQREGIICRATQDPCITVHISISSITNSSYSLGYQPEAVHQIWNLQKTKVNVRKIVINEFLSQICFWECQEITCSNYKVPMPLKSFKFRAPSSVSFSWSFIQVSCKMLLSCLQCTG